MNFAIPGNDDAILRWNTCARVIMKNPDVRPEPASEAAEGGSATKPAPESQTLSIRCDYITVEVGTLA